MIKIPILSILMYSSVLFFTWLFFRWLFQYVIHPDYRWHQKGNVCYEERNFFAGCWSIVTTILFAVIINIGFDFELN